MCKRLLLALCAVMLLSGVASAVDMWFQTPGGVPGDWSDLSNWYLDDTLTTPATALPTGADRVRNLSIASDMAAVTDWTTGWPYVQTYYMGSYFNWTNQIINITTDAACGDNRIGGGETDTPYPRGFSNSTINVGDATHNVTFSIATCTISRKGYDAVEMNIAAGSTVAISNKYEGNGQYRAITNVAGTMTIVNALELDPSNGWAMSDYIGDLLFDDDGDGIETTHTMIDGYYPLEWAEYSINILDGGLVTAGSVYWPGPASAAPGNTAKINITGSGLLVVSGDQVAALQAYRADGLFTGDGVVGGVAITFDGTNTNVYVPEPTTMLMLGLGVVGLIRRRKIA